jgi:hypothetical protein
VIAPNTFKVFGAITEVLSRKEMEVYLDHIKLKEISLHQAGFEEFIPCTEEEIVALEHWIGHSFPLSYREFLKWMGRWGGGLFRGSECFYSDLKIIQKWARELLKENNCSETLLENAFVFLMHHGYHILYFKFNEGDDPPVYSYLEDIEESQKKSIQQKYSYFSEFLDITLENSIDNSKKRFELGKEAMKASPGQAKFIENFNKSLNKRPNWFNR